MRERREPVKVHRLASQEETNAKPKTIWKSGMEASLLLSS